MSTKDITIIMGPTAIGKTAFAIKLALETNAEIISADAYQVYRRMTIGTAKPTPSELNTVTHHLIDIRDPSDSYSVADFLDESTDIIEQLRKKEKPIIICGGTGFFIHAFLYQYSFSDDKIDLDYRDTLNKQLREEGLQSLQANLLAIDPIAADYIDIDNPRRVLRSLEILHSTGHKPSELPPQPSTMREDTRLIGLRGDKTVVHDRISTRVDTMIEAGLVDEVKSLLNSGISPEAQAMQAIGYKEVIQYVNGSLPYGDMVNLIKIKTRQFSKRQMTWFKRFDHAEWIDIS